MILEKIIEERYEIRQPLTIFFLSFLISVIALFISYTVFKENTGLFTVIIISLIMVPFMNKMLHHEEHETGQRGGS
ncbi:MAG: hypothetical protein DRO11_06970 [Methanobacteriota archaeon]|nr:MAG: hypothetical protein DRO11_06970 [Euryarchaeota archaeon]